MNDNTENRNYKKLATLSVALGLSAITLISSISAYFTDADTATNEFTIGKVSLDLQEPNWIPPENITPNQVIKKDPQIKNDGINDEFVFLTVKVPIKNIVTAELDGTKLPATETELFTYTINENWTQVGNDIKTNDSVTRIYAYAKDNQCIALKKNETTNPLFDTVKVCNATEDQGLELTKEQIVINAYGIQTKDINDTNGIDKTAPADVWEVINNQRDVDLKPEEESVSVLIRGKDLQGIRDVFKSATSIQFVKNRPIPEGTQTIDFSENQDNSIQAWQEGNTVYINSENKILANEDCSRMFFENSRLKEISFKNFDTSNVTDMNSMFCDCSSLTSLDLSSFDTSNVTDISAMFANCKNLKELNLSNFNTVKVTNMTEMFHNCSSLTNLDLSNFNTSSVTYMNAMFFDCNALKILNLNSFKTSKVTDMGNMFSNCSSLESLDLNSFNTSKVTDMGNMFSNCSSLESLDLNSFNTFSVTNMSEMFHNCSSLTSLDLNSFNTSKVTDMGNMFSNCSSLESLDLNSFNTFSVTNMSEMFHNCSSLTSLDLNSFDTSNVTDMSLMFESCKNLSTLDLSNFKTKNLKDIGRMFYNCSNLTELDFSSLDNISYIYGRSDILVGCNSLKNVYVHSLFEAEQLQIECDNENTKFIVKQ